LFDITGRVIQREEFIKELTIDTKNLANGMYIVRIADENGNIYNNKVIKQ
jgi:hypothetical protein